MTIWFEVWFCFVSKRRRPTILAWLVAITLVSIATIGLIATQFNDWAFPLIYIAMCIIPFRIYSIYLAWCFSKEVVLYPDKSPVIRVVKEAPSTVTYEGGGAYPVSTQQRVAYPQSQAPAYGYGGYGAYGGGYGGGYGGYGRGGYYGGGGGFNDGLGTGLVLGTLAAGHHGGYGHYGYYDGCGYGYGYGGCGGGFGYDHYDVYDDYGYDDYGYGGGGGGYDDFGGDSGGYYDSDY